MREISSIVEEILGQCNLEPETRNCLRKPITEALIRDRKRLNEKFQMAIGAFRIEIENSLLPKEGNDGATGNRSN